jgi:hypothetical protein
MELFKEALEIAARDRAEAATPEIMRRMQGAMAARMGAQGAAMVPGTNPAEAALEGQLPYGRRHHILDQPLAPMPPGFIDPLYQGALAELSHWMQRNERYRGQGDFARIERVFEVIKEALG